MKLLWFVAIRVAAWFTLLWLLAFIVALISGAVH